MRTAEIVEIYVPAYRDFGWIRARTRRGRISTFKLARPVLEDMAHDVQAKPENRLVIDSRRVTKDSTWANRWPPAVQVSTWLVREPVDGRTRWRRLKTGR